MSQATTVTITVGQLGVRFMGCSGRVGGEMSRLVIANRLHAGRFQLADRAAEVAQLAVAACAVVRGRSGAVRRASSGARGCADAPRTPSFAGPLPA